MKEAWHIFKVLMGPENDLRRPQVPWRIYSYTGKQAFSVESFGSDITGNGIANLVIRQWQGSAHGDSRYHVLEIEDSAVKKIGVIDGLLGVELKDLNDDGIDEITGLDTAYSYFGGDSFASSPLPLVVLSFNKNQGKFIPDRQLMSKRSFSRDKFNELGLKYRQDIRWSKVSRPPTELFASMLELIYSGNENQAWELFEASWPDVTEIPKHQYKKSLKADMRESPFYSVIAEWNKEI